ERTRVVGHAGAGDRSEVLDRRGRQLDAGDHRARRWRDRRPARRRRAGNSRREPAGGTRRVVLIMPTLASFWQTSYGKSLLVKITLLAAALLLAAVNLLRNVPRFKASGTRPELGAPAAGLLRRLVAGEALLVSCAVLAAAVLS